MRRVTIYLFVIVIAFAVGLAVGCVKPRISAETRLAESYAIYSTIIDNSRAGDEGKLVLIASKTRSVYRVENTTDEIEFIKRSIPAGTSKETLVDFKSEDRKPQELTVRFALTNQYLLVSNETRFFETEETVHAFRATYPNSTGQITCLSNVGFNDKMDEALVQAWGYCGGDCGGGGYYLLRKKNGIWKVEDGKLWIS
jgi:hypothetical protein